MGYYRPWQKNLNDNDSLMDLRKILEKNEAILANNAKWR